MAAIISGLGQFPAADAERGLRHPRERAALLDRHGARAGRAETQGCGLAAVALAAFFLLRATKTGRFIYAVGDNPRAAHVTGVPVRPIIVLKFVLSSLAAFVAGLITATSVSSMKPARR